MRFRWPLSSGVTPEPEEPADEPNDLCQALLVRVREPLAAVRAALATAAIEYSRVLTENGEDVKLPETPSARSRLAALGADAERRLAKRRPAPDVFTMSAVMIGRVLDGDDKARSFLSGIDPVVIAALAVREACARGRNVAAKLDEDVANFARSDSKAERSKKKRKLVLLAKYSERCKRYTVTLDNLQALLDGRTSTSVPRHVDSCSSTASIQSSSDAVDDDDDDETVDLRYWRTESYEDFIADTGPVSF
mmetsp:Transcript_9976/g.32058  ORF Transcript_9976/g.32058 Transcript_9976/m.32058 type:complete len:250 (-) Transcript_9976:160-909(-)